MDRITEKADELGRKHPDLQVKVNTAAASAKLAVLKRELKDTADAANKDTGQNFMRPGCPVWPLVSMVSAT